MWGGLLGRSLSYLDRLLAAIKPFLLNPNFLVFSKCQFPHLPCNGVHIHPQFALHKCNNEKVKLTMKSSRESVAVVRCVVQWCLANKNNQHMKATFTMPPTCNIFPNYLTSIVLCLKKRFLHTDLSTNQYTVVQKIQPVFFLWRRLKQSLRAGDLALNSPFNGRSSKPDYLLDRSVI